MTVDWTTADGTATLADNEYNFTSGTVQFLAGETSKTFTVQVNGDTAEEAHETFLVNLTNLQGGTTPASIVDAQAIGTILNDDTTVSISDAAVTEGDDRVVFLDEFVPDGRAGLDLPTALEYGPQDTDGDGKPDHLFVVSFIGRNVLRYDAQTGSQGQVFVPVESGGMNLPNHVLFGPDDNLYVVDQMASAVFRFDGLTGAPLPAPGKTGATFISTGDGGLLGPRGIVFDAAGDAYVTSFNSDEVIKYQGPSGANPGELIGVFVTAGSGGLDAPRHLVFEPDGHLYVTSYFSDAVLRFDGATGAPTDLQFTPDGNLLVASTTTDAARRGGVLRYGAASQAVFTVSLSRPVGEQVSVDVSTADGTAKTTGLPGEMDYEPILPSSPKTIVIGPDDVSVSVLVPVLDDGVEEPQENFAANLSNIVGATAGDPFGTGTIVDDDSAPPPPPPPDANDIYVWDIVFDTRTRGQGGAKHDEQVLVTIRRDSDANGTDELVAGASVTVVVTGPQGGTFSGTTDAAGVFTTGWLSNLPDATYTAEVTALTHSSFIWNGILDPTANDADSDGDGLPDDSHAIPHSASAAVSTQSSTRSTKPLSSAELVDLIYFDLGSTSPGNKNRDESDSESARTELTDYLLYGLV